MWVEIIIRHFENLYLTAKLYKIQNLHLFPFNSKTSTRPFRIESRSFLRVSDGISFQHCWMQNFKVSLSSNWRLFLYNLLDKIPHKFSVGFKSEDWVGQSKTSIFFVLNQSFVSWEVCVAALSYWKMALLVSRRLINRKTFPQHIDKLNCLKLQWLFV